MSLDHTAFTVPLPSRTLDEAVREVTEALKAQGFGTLFDLDLEGTLRTKVGAEIGGYRLLGACNPGIAARAIAAEPGIGVFLPCNVIVRSVEGGAEARLVRPRGMMGDVDAPAIAPMMEEAETRLAAVAASLRG